MKYERMFRHSNKEKKISVIILCILAFISHLADASNKRNNTTNINLKHLWHNY